MACLLGHKNSTQAATTMRRNSFRGKAAFLASIKRIVDTYLKTVTDEPCLIGCYRSTDAASNSLVHQMVRRNELDP